MESIQSVFLSSYFALLKLKKIKVTIDLHFFVCYFATMKKFKRKTPYEIVVNNLHKLNQKELKKLTASVEFLLTEEISIVADSSKLFYETLTATLSTHLGQDFIPFHLVRKKYGKKLTEVSNFLDKYLEKIHIVNTRTQTQIYKLYAELLIKHIENSPLPMTLNVLLGIYDQFPAVLEKSFPGYMKAGLTGSIFDQRSLNP